MDNKPLYKFKTSGSTKVTSLNLGWQVMPETELVKTSSGEELERNRDYIIDYESGTVELISPRALAADNVDVTFQQEAMFVPESKAFLVCGERWRYHFSARIHLSVHHCFSECRNQ
jgi:cell surface protein SprA